LKKGHVFASETDTEVLAHLIEEYLDTDLRAAVTKALARVEGSYGIGVLWTGMPDTLIAARNHSPLVIGVHEEEGGFMASDVPPLLPYTNQIVFLDDQELVVLKADSHTIYSLVSGEKVEKEVQTISWNSAMAEKGGYKHFMLKEIYEQPQAIIDTVSGRINPETGSVELAEMNLSDEDLAGIDRIFLWPVERPGMQHWLLNTGLNVGQVFRLRWILLQNSDTARSLLMKRC